MKYFPFFVLVNSGGWLIGSGAKNVRHNSYHIGGFPMDPFLKDLGFFPEYPTKGYPASKGLLTIIVPSYSPNKALFFGGGGGGNFCDTDNSSKSHCQGMGSDGFQSSNLPCIKDSQLCVVVPTGVGSKLFFF